MDMALDEIVKASRAKKAGRGRRPNRSARAKVLGNTSTTAAKSAAKRAAATQATAKTATATAPLAQMAEKILVSGFPLDVNESEIKDLFASTVGPVRNVQLHFNPQGRWNGSATIVFNRKGDGSKAYEQYHTRLVDGKRPMKVELIFDPAKAPPVSLASRVGPAPKVAGAELMDGAQRTRGRPRRARRARNPRPAKTAEDLDAEMEDYTAASNAPAVA